MIPDDRARVYHERLAASPLTIALLTANSLRNLAKRIEVVCPRNEGIADSVRALAADLTDFSLRDDAMEEQRAQDRASAESDEFVRRHAS